MLIRVLLVVVLSITFTSFTPMNAAAQDVDPEITLAKGGLQKCLEECGMKAKKCYEGCSGSWSPCHQKCSNIQNKCHKKCHQLYGRK